MTLRRRSFSLVLLASLAGCITQPAPVRLVPVPIEALADESSIRARCVDPDAVIARRAPCVLKDLPSNAAVPGFAP